MRNNDDIHYIQCPKAGTGTGGLTLDIIAVTANTIYLDIRDLEVNKHVIYNLPNPTSLQKPSDIDILIRGDSGNNIPLTFRIGTLDIPKALIRGTSMLRITNTRAANEYNYMLTPDSRIDDIISEDKLITPFSIDSLPAITVPKLADNTPSSVLCFDVSGAPVTIEIYPDELLVNNGGTLMSYPISTLLTIIAGGIPTSVRQLDVFNGAWLDGQLVKYDSATDSFIPILQANVVGKLPTYSGGDVVGTGTLYVEADKIMPHHLINEEIAAGISAYHMIVVRIPFTVLQPLLDNVLNQVMELPVGMYIHGIEIRHIVNSATSPLTLQVTHSVAGSNVNLIRAFDLAAGAPRALNGSNCVYATTPVGEQFHSSLLSSIPIAGGDDIKILSSADARTDADLDFEILIYLTK